MKFRRFVWLQLCRGLHTTPSYNCFNRYLTCKTTLIEVKCYNSKTTVLNCCTLVQFISLKAEYAEHKCFYEDVTGVMLHITMLNSPPNTTRRLLLIIMDSPAVQPKYGAAANYYRYQIALQLQTVLIFTDLQSTFPHPQIHRRYLHIPLYQDGF